MEAALVSVLLTLADFRLLKGFTAEKEYKYITYGYKKACNLEKMYLWHKILERLPGDTGRPVISSCGMPTENISEFLNYRFKTIMQNCKSCIRDHGHLIKKIENINNLLVLKRLKMQY